MIQDQVQQAMAQAAWGLLGALGMSSSQRVVVHRAIEPESSLILAALASPGDPRLADEARDWLVVYQDLVSRAVLKNRLSQLDAEANSRWREFASPVVPLLSRRLPGADVVAAKWSRSGKSARVALQGDVATGYLRYRAAFGVQARAGILQLLAGGDDAKGWMADALARSSGYQKPAVREALDRMVEAGLVRVNRVGNTDWFAAVAPAKLQGIAGPPGSGVVDFDLAVAGLWALRTAAQILDTESSAAGPVRALHALSEGAAGRVLGHLRIDVPLPSGDIETLRADLERCLVEASTRLGDVGRPLWPW